jgi:flavin reductase (DIM6/NTAB) family NADH-FMN oxidoreductase RutF
MAALNCTLQEKLEGGDHWIMVGQVAGLWRADDLSDPLLYYRGQYHGLADTNRAD